MYVVVPRVETLTEKLKSKQTFPGLFFFFALESFRANSQNWNMYRLIIFRNSIWFLRFHQRICTEILHSSIFMYNFRLDILIKVQTKEIFLKLLTCKEQQRQMKKVPYTKDL